MNLPFTIKNGWLVKASTAPLTNIKPMSNVNTAAKHQYPDVLTHKLSPHCNNRPNNEVSLLVIHNISLPPGKFGSNHISDLFLGCLNPDDDACFADIYQLKVSAHLLIRRNGELIQYVPFTKRAWHAGVSSFEGRDGCNDFSIGVEMEGTDTVPYTDEQYAQLALVSKAILKEYPNITKHRITGHSDIAPHRKTDPGESFDWRRYKAAL